MLLLTGRMRTVDSLNLSTGGNVYKHYNIRKVWVGVKIIVIEKKKKQPRLQIPSCIQSLRVSLNNWPVRSKYSWQYKNKWNKPSTVSTQATHRCEGSSDGFYHFRTVKSLKNHTEYV